MLPALMCTEIEEDGCRQGDQVCVACFIVILSSWRLCGFDHYTENCEPKRTAAFIAVMDRTLQYTDQYSCVHFLPSPHYLLLEYCLTLIFILSFMSLDPLLLAVQITIQLPRVQNISTKPHVLEIHWSHHSSSSYCFQAMKDSIQCTKVFPLTQ